MTTWTCKPLTVLALIGFLSACDDALDASGGLLAAIAPPEDAALPAVPLTQALMMRGQVTLVPPSGFCIDPESLSQSFALMGRCEAMGASGGAAGAPAGVMTVSVARSAKNAPLPTAVQIAEAAGVTPPSDVQQTADRIIFMTTGIAPSGDLSSEHWRGVLKLDRFTIGAALFGPEGRRAVSPEGARVIQDMLDRTATKTNES